MHTRTHTFLNITYSAYILLVRMFSGMTIWHNHPSKKKVEGGSLYWLIRLTAVRSSSILLALSWRQPKKVRGPKNHVPNHY